ncbi:hypothetical protein D3C80_1551350 [compost metagenome]
MNLWTTSEELDDTCSFRQTQNVLAWDVSYNSATIGGIGADEWNEVVFTDRSNTNVLDGNELTFCRHFVLDGGAFREVVVVEAGAGFVYPHLSDATRGIDQAVVLTIQTQQVQDSFHVFGDFLNTLLRGEAGVFHWGFDAFGNEVSVYFLS